MQKLRIKEAIRLHNIITGEKLTQSDIAVCLWPGSSLRVARVNFYRLSNGVRNKFNSDWIRIISEVTGIDSNWILGIKTKVDYSAYEELLLNPPKRRKKKTN